MVGFLSEWAGGYEHQHHKKSIPDPIPGYVTPNIGRSRSIPKSHIIVHTCQPIQQIETSKNLKRVRRIYKIVVVLATCPMFYLGIRFLGDTQVPEVNGSQHIIYIDNLCPNIKFK